MSDDSERDPDSGNVIGRIGHNGVRPEALQGYVDRIENVLDQIESERGTFMAKCKTLREDIREIYTEAADKGVSKAALKAVVKTRELEARADKIRDELDGDLQESFDAIRLALGDLGDLPLGSAVLAKHPDAPQPA